MRFTFETEGVRLSWAVGGRLLLEAGNLRLELDANAAAAMAEAFAAAASLLELNAPVPSTAAAVAARKAPSTPVVVAATAPRRAPEAADDGATDGGAQSASARAAAPYLLAGEPVKRGPRACAERAGPRKGKRPGRRRAGTVEAMPDLADPNAPIKRGPRASARRAGPGTIAPASEPKPAGNDAAETRSRKPLVDTMAAWMAEHEGAQPVEALVAAAVEGGWTAAKDVSPAIRAALGRRADVFARQPDGAFVLRASLPPGRVVRRRPGDR